MKDYVSLDNKTEYSLLQSLIKPIDLFKKAKELNQSAVAVTDKISLAGAWDSLKASKETGVKLIIGQEFYFTDNLEDKNSRLRHIILLAKNHQGYKNLLLASKLGYDNFIELRKKVIPRIDWKILEQCQEGLICTTACAGGILGQLINTRKIPEAKVQAKRLKDIFGDNLALEIQPHGLKRTADNAYSDYVDQIFTNNQLIKIGQELDIKVIAACDAHYLNKEDAEAHDVALAIGSGQPVKSGNRLKYNVSDLYLKSRDQVVEFFSRHYGKKAEEFCDNTLYFSDQCEKPDWIDPKFSNPSGKELPTFPVKDQEDYLEFKNWLDNDGEKYKSLEEDKSYLRFCVEREFLKKIPQDKIEIYRSRIEEELDVFYHCGVSSYLLIVADFLDWCRKNNIAIGPGRGCTIEDTLVLTSLGFKKINEIEIGESVYTHSGKIKKVINKFEFDLDQNEELIEISSQFSFNKIILTKDHKVLAHKRKYNDTYYRYLKNNNKNINKICKFNDSKIDLEWIEASKLERNDFVFMPYIARRCTVQKTTKANFNVLFKKHNKTKNINLDLISRDEEFYYFVGRWIGDGWYYNSGLAIAFGSEDESINKIINYLNKLNIKNKVFKNRDGKNMHMLVIYNRHIKRFFQLMFKDYKNTSATKHLPLKFKLLSKSLLKSLLIGLQDSDGHIEINKERCSIRENIDTTSLRLALEIKEALLYLNIKSSINTRKPFKRGKYLCNTSYKLRFKGLTTKRSQHEKIKKIGEFKNGSLIKITDIKILKNHEYKKVYDLTIENDHSYLTSNFVISNSVGGSLTCHLLNIHQADSIKYGLVFPRFHNKLKVALSDIDSDISTANRHLLEQYLENKYGTNCFAHITNYNTLTPKVYIKSISRVFQYGGDAKAAVAIGNKIADLVSVDYKDINTALEKIPLFAEYNKKYTEIGKFAETVGNKIIALSTHAAAVVINSRPLVDIIPLRKDKNGTYVVEYEKERAEANGLVKIDVLGLSTLDIIENTKQLIKKVNKELLPFDYNVYDQKTYDLISSGDTLCVFQFGTSAGTISLCKQLKPKSVEDLAIITTLARPAAKAIRQEYIENSQSNKKAELLHPSMERAFKETNGYALFDESLLILANDVAGWDLNKADVLRKMTKDKGKHPEKVKQWKEEFIQDSINRGIKKDIATKIWVDVIEPFGTYSFNKSHAVLYSFISVETAFLKAHYPLEFLTANLTFESQSNAPSASENKLKIKNEIRKHKVRILPPDLNTSEMTYTITSEQTLMTGLDALKFMGTQAIPEILTKRPFTSLEDFLIRVDGRKVTSAAVQALAGSGALDSFIKTDSKLSRRLIFLYASDFKKKLAANQKRKHKVEFKYPWPTNEREWTLPEKFAMEQYYLGEGLCCGKMEAYAGFFNSTAINLASLPTKYPDTGDDDENKHFLSMIQGEIKDMFEFKVKNESSKIYGQTMGKMVIEDPYGNTINVTYFPQKLEHFHKRFKILTSNKLTLEPGVAIYFSAYTNWYEGELNLTFEDLLKVAPPPPLPKDLSSKKVEMKTNRSKKNLEELEKMNQEEIMEEIESELEDEGLVDLEEFTEVMEDDLN